MRYDSEIQRLMESNEQAQIRKHEKLDREKERREKLLRNKP